MLWSASAKTKNPDAAVAFIDWLVNSPEAADLLLAERVMPANGEIQAAIKPKLSKDQQTVQQFLTDIKPELADTPIAPPPGGGKVGDVMLRFATEVLFGRQSTARGGAGLRGRDEVEPPGLMMSALTSRAPPRGLPSS